MKKHVVMWMAMMLMMGSASQAVLVELAPVADSYVDSGSVSSSYGSSSWLQIQGYADGVGSFDSVQRTYLKFDLSSAGIPEGVVITSAVFGIYLNEINEGTFNAEDPYAGLYYVQDDSWQDNTLTWNNVPAYDAAAYEGISKLMVDEGQYFEWNLLSESGAQWTNYAADLADGFISFAMVTEFEDFNTRAIFNSVNNEVNQPYLKITYVIPEPATMLLLGLGSVLSFGKRRFA